jgi:pimeloyl-ACP methyl ester carboxylesterase
MPQLRANNIDIEYEILGAPEAPPLLLVMGLGMQMIAWPDNFCAALVTQGFRVIRFDNRDVGLSTRMSHLGAPNIPLEFIKYTLHLPLKAPYSLDDMARDTAALLDALEIPNAHVVGASMGGMIAQNLAAKFPHKVASLTSIMSSTGRRGLPGPTRAARNAVLTPPAKRGDVEGAVTRMKKVLRAIGSPGFPEDDAVLTAFCDRHVRRAYDPPGVARQLVAVSAAGDRTDIVRRITAPTLVLHGREDPLLPLACGIDTHKAVVGAKLSVIDGMGHDLPAALHQRLAEEIAAHCHAAGGIARLQAASLVARTAIS